MGPYLSNWATEFGESHTRDMRKEARIRAALVSEVDEALRHLGVASEPLMALAGIDSVHLKDWDQMIPFRTVLRLFEVATEQTGLEDFGLKVAEVRGIPNLGLVMMMLQEQVTVREALSTLTTMLYLHTDGLYVQLEDVGEEAILTIHLEYVAKVSSRPLIDLGIAGLTQVIRTILGEDWSPKEIFLSYSRPNRIKNYSRFFNCPIEYSQEISGILIDRSDLDRPVLTSSATARRRIDLQKILIASSNRAYEYRVKQLVVMAIATGNLSAEWIAARLGTNRRTLNKRLATAGCCYSDIVQDVRTSLATQHLSSSNKSLSEIALLVGFGNLSSFSRWFTASFGQSPSHWRRTIRLQ